MEEQALFFAGKNLRIAAEKLAILIRSKDIHAFLKLSGKPTTPAVVFVGFLSVKLDPERSDMAAGDPGAGRAELFRVVRTSQAEIVPVLIHHHRLVADALLAARVPEARLLSGLEAPAPTPGVAPDRPERAIVMARPSVVPAMHLACLLQVLTSGAAVLPVPPILIDRHGVRLVRVGQLGHPAPDMHWLERVKLPKLEQAVRTGGHVGGIGLHSAVGAPGPVLRVRDPGFVLASQRLIVLSQLVNRLGAAFAIEASGAPLFGELVVTRIVGFLIDRLEISVIITIVMLTIVMFVLIAIAIVMTFFVGKGQACKQGHNGKVFSHFS